MPIKQSKITSSRRRIITSDSSSSEEDNDSNYTSIDEDESSLSDEDSSSDSDDSSDVEEAEAEAEAKHSNSKKTKTTGQKSQKVKAKAKEQILSEEEGKKAKDKKGKHATDKKEKGKIVKDKKEKNAKKPHKKKCESSDEDDDEDYEEDESEEDVENKVSIFLIGGGEENDDYNSEYEDTDDDDEKSVHSSEDERVFMKENYQNVPIVLSKKSTPKKEKDTIQKEKDAIQKEKDDTHISFEQEYLELLDLRRDFTSQLEKKPNNKIILRAIKNCNNDIKDLVHRGRKGNTKAYYKLIHQDTKRIREIDYFETKLSNKEQQKIVEDLKHINSTICIDKPYRLALLESDIPSKHKVIALQKLNSLHMMEPGDSEYFKLRGWVDAFMNIPFGIYRNLPVKLDDGVDKCHEFMENANKMLNMCTYGMDEAKMQIIQLLGNLITNPDVIGNAIALKGPPGSGKTSLVKYGISKILGREFVFIPLGGCSDASYLEGHSYTYEGSMYGKIIQSIIQCKSMNPIFFFDELDKVSDTPKGQEIIGILTHLTDATQNDQYHDKYFSEVDFDLSKCLFIFSYNDESLVNPILRDRMYKIFTKGYNTKEKVIIANDYLLPKIREQIHFNKEDIIIPTNVMEYIITNDAFTQKEEGVRNLKRCLEIIHTKLNLFRLVKSDSKPFFAKDIALTVTFPYTLSKADIDVLIKIDDANRLQDIVKSMYV